MATKRTARSDPGLTIERVKLSAPGRGPGGTTDKIDREGNRWPKGDPVWLATDLQVGLSKHVRAKTAKEARELVIAQGLRALSAAQTARGPAEHRRPMTQREAMTQLVYPMPGMPPMTRERLADEHRRLQRGELDRLYLTEKELQSAPEPAGHAAREAFEARRLAVAARMHELRGQLGLLRYPESPPPPPPPRMPRSW